MQGQLTTLNGLAKYLANQMISAARESPNLNLPHPNGEFIAADPFFAMQTWLEQVETKYTDRIIYTPIYGFT